MTPVTPDPAVFARAFSTAVANWEALYRAAMVVTGNTTAGMMRMMEIVTTTSPAGEPFDVDVPQGEGVRVNG